MSSLLHYYTPWPAPASPRAWRESLHRGKALHVFKGSCCADIESTMNGQNIHCRELERWEHIAPEEESTAHVPAVLL
jgi:hypothetical protein